MTYDLYLSSTIAGGNGPLNEQLCRLIEANGFKVFLPQRDVPQDSTPEEMCRADFAAIEKSRLILAVFRNASRNFFIELGYAHGIKKSILAILQPGDTLDVMTATRELEQFKVTNADALDDFAERLVARLRAKLLQQPPEQDVPVLLLDKLAAYNRQKAGDANDMPLTLAKYDDSGELIGGLTGSTHWGWLYIDLFWLDERYRSLGFGKELLRAAEAEALRRGCHAAHLYTYSFQARGFYEKQGYSAFGELEDYPSGHRRFYLKKRLAPRT